MAGDTSPLLLVVDDDDDLRTLVSVVLEDEGFRVTTACNGAEALERVAGEMPRVILLDMKMPVMDGATFAAAFRARYGHAAKIVVLTAADNARKSAEAIGADADLGKPFDIDALVDLVRAQCGVPG